MSMRKDLDRTCAFSFDAFHFCAIATPVLVVGLVLFVLVSTGRQAAADSPGDRNIECLALTIYFEARGEPDEGKLAVGHVVMNRASHPRFPEDVCKVVQQGGAKVRYRCQFTWWCDGRSDTPTNARVWSSIKSLASRVYNRAVPDPTEGALWYHTVDVSPVWRHSLVEGPRIGQHIFYRGATKEVRALENPIVKDAPATAQDPVLLVPAGGTAPAAAWTAKASWHGPISACRWC